MARARIRLEEVTSFERLEEVRPDWERLWARSPGATPFSAPAWLLPWCRHLARDPPWSLLAWRGRELAGLAPTFVYADAGRRVLGLLGGGVSDYQDALAEDAPTALELLAGLLERRAAFDRCELEALPAGSPLLAAARALGLAASSQDVCPALPLPARAAELARIASPSLLADVRKQRRRLARFGALEVVHSTPATWRELLEDVLRLHRARWRSRGGNGVMGDADLERFHLHAAGELCAAGLLQLTAIQLDGRTIAALHALAARGRVHAYQQGIDPAMASYSPGSVLVASAVERAIADGASELDLLRGAEPYKYRWGAIDRPTFRLALPSADAASGHRASPPPPG